MSNIWGKIAIVFFITTVLLLLAYIKLYKKYLISRSEYWQMYNLVNGIEIDRRKK